MRDLQEIRIHRAIVHLVLPRHDRLVLSAAELQRDPPVETYLSRHVQRGLSDAQARAANFVVLGADRASGICDRLLGSRPRFVELSQQLAQRLYNVTEGDDRISDATLAVLLCEGATEHDGNQSFLALLKLDPSDAFRPVERRSRGQVTVQLALEENVLARNERVQKAAFVRPDDPSEEFRILLVDRQTEEPAARFFTVDFLGAELVLGPQERTRRLHRSLRQARNEVAPELNAKDLAALDQVIAGAQVSAKVNLDDLVETLPVRSSIRERVDEVLSRDLPDREFDLDPELAGRLVKRRTFVADNNLRISVPAEFVEEMLDVKDIPNTDPPKRRITIETQTWSEQ